MGRRHVRRCGLDGSVRLSRLAATARSHSGSAGGPARRSARRGAGVSEPADRRGARGVRVCGDQWSARGQLVHRPELTASFSLCRCTSSVRESRKPLRDNNHGQTAHHLCHELWNPRRLVPLCTVPTRSMSVRPTTRARLAAANPSRTTRAGSSSRSSTATPCTSQSPSVSESHQHAHYARQRDLTIP